MTGNRVIGESLPRIEDSVLVTGSGTFAADVNFPHQLHMRVVRSSCAHGELVGVNVEAARDARGVVAVWTSEQLPDLPYIDFREGPIPELQAYRQPILAKGRVRYVGEPVAVVFAVDPYLAEDAAELISIKINELPVLLSATDSPVDFAPGASTEATVVRKEYGDLASAFRSAAAIVELGLTVGRHSGVPLETRGAIGRYDAARDVLELHGAAKIPHRNREHLARMFDRPLSSVHLYEGHVGGGFGVRGELYPEDVLVLAAALRLRRPVKWIEDRYEHLMAANHSREQHHKIKAAVDARGKILAIDHEFFHDQGAYVRTHAARVVDLTTSMIPGPYVVPAFRSVGHFRLTNKTPAATYRAPGRYESTFVRERLMDAIATRLGLDVIEIRRRNLISKTQMPFKMNLTALGEQVEYDSGDYPLLLDKALARFGWTDFQSELRKRRANGDYVGAGISMFVEKSGLGPADGVVVSVDSSGTVEVVTGGASVGQGIETVVAQITAEALGVDYRRVRVIHGQTDRIAYGIGAHASRATVMTGSAAHNAALNLRAKALAIAGRLMQIKPDELDIVDGTVIPKGRSSGPSMGLAEVARHAAPGSPALGGQLEPGLSATGWHYTSHMAYPYGIHMAAVRIDRGTGQVDVERYLIAYDIGRAVNPMLVRGQIVGGFAQGLGGALYEEFLYDERGAPLAVTFADYLIPSAREVPAIDVLLTEDAPSPLNPLGLKGTGEAGVNGVGAAIAAAVADAIGMPGAVTQLPITPERLQKLLRRRPD